MTDVRTAAEALLYVLSGDHSQGEYQAAVETLAQAVKADAPADPAPVEISPVEIPAVDPLAPGPADEAATQ